ncbi:hypothetical protein [Aliivibrio sp. SR45-2]|uniref:hypothetical protein n=1 Tax=Aliivibrio sp. SR45-2 TaxID=2760931 RepID=UPI0015FB5C2C|nr:hypothetical protein [Aliivibrio sp. SR45-2]MBB1315807.1 hypothetical protein [Aliivibrio sp. SR45-2]
MQIIKTLADKHPEETIDTSSFNIDCRDGQFFIKYKLIGKTEDYEHPVIITGVDIQF